MKKIIPIYICLICLLLLIGCSKPEPDLKPVEVSEAFVTPRPTVEPTEAPTPVAVSELRVGGAIFFLPEGFSADVYDDSSFMLRSSTALIYGSWYDEDYFSYHDQDYPASSDEAASLLLPEAGEILSVWSDGEKTVVEYVEEGDGVRWETYSVYQLAEDLCWKVDFICPESIYEDMRVSFSRWADTMLLPSSLDALGAHTMISGSGLFSLRLPDTCFLIDDSTTPEFLALYGIGYDDAVSFLNEALAQGAAGDVICRADFGASLTITVDPYAGMMQSEMAEKEEELYIDGAVADESFSYEGIVTVGEGQDLFYLVRIEHDGYTELGFTTYHDATGASITFSFAGFSDEEAQEILETLIML